MLPQKIVSKMSKVNPRQVSSPTTPVGENERVVGTLGDDLKQLWVVYRDQRENVAKTAEELKVYLQTLQKDGFPDEEPEEFGRLAGELVLAGIEAEAVKRCFWASVRRRFPDTVCDVSIGLRKIGRLS